MFLLNVSTGRIYSFAVLIAILLLAFPEAEAIGFWRPPLTYSYGHITSYSGRHIRNVNLPASHSGKVIYRTTMNLQRRIIGINFIDSTRSYPEIWMSEWPPCTNPIIEIRSPDKLGIDMKIEFFTENRY